METAESSEEDDKPTLQTPGRRFEETVGQLIDSWPSEEGLETSRTHFVYFFGMLQQDKRDDAEKRLFAWDTTCWIAFCHKSTTKSIIF